MKALGIALALFAAGLPLCVASCSSAKESPACTVDSECKGDRICGPDGTCVDPDEPPGAGDAGGGGNGGAGSGEPASSAEGTPCEISGSNCDPDCLLNCGSASCADLCCSDTTSLGVRCDGQCRAPTCTVNEDFEEELAARPWICFEAQANGKTYCGCTNHDTAETIEDRGHQVVSSCTGAYCAFYDDEGNRDCQCRGDDASIKLTCGHTAGCQGPIADCADAPVPTCENKCARPVYE